MTYFITFKSQCFYFEEQAEVALSRASGKLSKLLNGRAEDRCSPCLLYDWNTWQLVGLKQTTCHSNEGGGSAVELGIMGNVVPKRICLYMKYLFLYSVLLDFK